MESNLESTLKKMKKCQHEVTLNRRLLANSYNIAEIEKIESNIREKELACKKLKSENKTIKKWLKQNEKDKASICENGFYDDEVYRLKSEYREDKAKIREMYYNTLKKRKQLIERHDCVVRVENNVRKMRELIDTTKKNESTTPKPLDIAKHDAVVMGKAWDVDEMRKKVESAKATLKREQSVMDKEAKGQEDKISELEYQVKLLQLKVREKDKELSLATLKAKELKRNIRYNSLKPLSQTPGQLKSHRVNTRIMRSIEGSLYQKQKLARDVFKGKRNSTDDYTRMPSNNGHADNKNLTISESNHSISYKKLSANPSTKIGSEIRLEKSESSVVSNDKNPIMESSLKNTKRFVRY